MFLPHTLRTEQAKANNLKSCPMILRVMRDFCKHEPAWVKLSQWVSLQSFSGEPILIKLPHPMGRSATFNSTSIIQTGLINFCITGFVNFASYFDFFLTILNDDKEAFFSFC